MLRWLAGRDLEGVAVLRSSTGLMGGRMASMGLGFLTWIVAARLIPPHDVGLAAGTVAAMMLCVQIALVGAGAALIAMVPLHRAQPGPLLNTAALVVLVLGFGMAVGFLMIARGAFTELNSVVAHPLAIAAFLAMVAFGALNVLQDHASIAFRRGGQVLARNTVFGATTLACIAIGVITAGTPGFMIILAAWAVASVIASTLGIVQIHETVPDYRLASYPDTTLLAPIFRVGWLNWALTMTERVPVLTLPILVTELLSPETNAYWYAVWMMAWVVVIVPISFGQSLFAEAVARPSSWRNLLQQGLRSSLTFGLAAAIAVAAMAELVLNLLGSNYAAVGAWPLRVLVFSVIPAAFIQAYFAMCRARGRLAEAITLGAIGGTVSVALTTAAGLNFELLGMATAWVAAQSGLALVAAARLRSLASEPAPAD